MSDTDNLIDVLNKVREGLPIECNCQARIIELETALQRIFELTEFNINAIGKFPYIRKIAGEALNLEHGIIYDK